MEPFLGFLKNWLRPVKHWFFRSASSYRLRWQGLVRNHDAVRIRRVATNTPRYLSRTLSQRELVRSLVEVDSAQPFVPAPSKTLGNTRLTADARSTYRAAFVVRLENVRVFGEVGHILTGDGTLLADLSFVYPATWYGDSAWPDLLCPHEPEQQLSGSTCVLASRWAGYNYFHYLFELLPRCEMVHRSGIDLDSIDHFVVNPLNPLHSNVYWQGLDEVGVDRERVLFCESPTVFNVSHVVAPSTLRGTGHMRKWVCEWLNHTFGQRTISHGSRDRLYVGRDDAGNRRVRNQSEILEHVLSPIGFEHVRWDGRSIREQAALFGRADVVVAANGAALSNLVFCRPGTRVIVLHRPTYLSPVFYQLSHTVGLDYYHLTGEATTPVTPKDSASDFCVNPESLVELLKFAEVT
jgi:hypothetical protein